jgi:1D-myo-inositol-tetrakisphosphate 5-kinase/inositol-polyphosphate multikinase
VYDSEKDDFTKYSKHYGKGLTEDTVLDGFRAYFAAKLGPERMRLIIERFVNDLTDFLATIETQELRMRSSSLLMIYEGDAEAFDAGLSIEQEKIAAVVARAQAHMEKGAREDQEGDDEDDDNEEDEDDEDFEDYEEDDEEDGEVGQKVTDMRLIDFAHSTWTPGQGPDEGVVKGVKSALALFEKLLKEDYQIEA